MDVHSNMSNPWVGPAGGYLFVVDVVRILQVTFLMGSDPPPEASSFFPLKRASSEDKRARFRVNVWKKRGVRGVSSDLI